MHRRYRRWISEIWKIHKRYKALLFQISFIIKNHKNADKSRQGFESKLIDTNDFVKLHYLLLCRRLLCFRCRKLNSTKCALDTGCGKNYWIWFDSHKFGFWVIAKPFLKSIKNCNMFNKRHFCNQGLSSENSEIAMSNEITQNSQW